MVRYQSKEFRLEPLLTDLRERIERRDCVVGIIGLGYVGLPLSVEVARAGHHAVGVDVNERVVQTLRSGASHIPEVPSDDVSSLVRTGRLTATTDAGELARCDVVVICVPTPLNKLKDPDLSYVVLAAKAVRASLRKGQLVILESTTYPGTTRDIVLPVLAESGLTVGEDFFLCFSPERVDPGNPRWNTKNTPKLIGGLTPACSAVGAAFYATVVDKVVPVTSAEVAELAKVYENTFRMINIALANELAQVCARLRLNVWEVIEAAATKPFGFMKFTPGPGLGGHCIPLDPHYLSWKMESLDFKTRMIELASEINGRMPDFVVQLVADALNDEAKALRGSRILVLGVAYKKDVGDYRESPAIEIIQLLAEKGAEVRYHDPLCPSFVDDGLASLVASPMRSVDLTDFLLAETDVVVVVTDHSAIDYERIADRARLVVDCRGVMSNRGGRARVVGLSGQTTGVADEPVAVGIR
ncbi:MAG TPA: nucleotide sugar dehydrogenase [Thermomicrobiales bacterium]|jgi:UDP-N-acetyl-D-glucosamine dehydrogenase